jgi:phosphoglycolate phosphatase-like HAD superfamily hydrolase
MLKVLILDFDGVIIESNAVKKEAFEHVFGRFPEHHAAMMAFHHANVSMGRYGKFDHLLERLGRVGDLVFREKIAADYSDFVVKEMLRVPLVPGALEFLREVTPRLPVYLASVTPAEELTQTLANRGLTSWFRSVYGCPPWTKPGAIQDVLQRERISPAETLLIGDSAGDQRAAHATGVPFLARNSGLPFEDPRPKQFNDLHEIAAYLRPQLR